MSYNRLNPYFGHIEERFLLNKPSSSKETWHVRLNIDNSQLQFRVGDSIGVLPRNDPETVLKTLDVLKVDPQKVFQDPRTQDMVSAFDLLSKRYSIRNLPKKALLKISETIPSDSKDEFLALLEKEESWIRVHELNEWLEFAPGTTVTFEELLGVLQPLLPRFYSIASSQAALPQYVDLAIARVCFEVHGKPQVGVCSHYLTKIAPLSQPEVGLYIQPTNHFLFPQADDVPVILIGPGTGVAPFRAYLQERALRKGHGKVWLFFGERNRNVDFLYEDFWKELSTYPFFQMDVAFSRDTESKVYVQHKIWEKREEILSWLDNGARIYLCGAIQMGKDVEETLVQILQERYLGDRAAALENLKALRKAGRILKDVY